MSDDYNINLKPRPISPHLTIYKPQITSVLSILHRISGAVNFFGILLFTWWIIFMGAYGYAPEETLLWSFLSGYIGIIFLMGFSFSMIFHLCTGIRHLFWDAGYGFKTTTVTKTGIMAISFALLIFISLWITIFFVI